MVLMERDPVARHAVHLHVGRLKASGGSRATEPAGGGEAMHPASFMPDPLLPRLDPVYAFRQVSRAWPAPANELKSSGGSMGAASAPSPARRGGLGRGCSDVWSSPVFVQAPLNRPLCAGGEDQEWAE